VPLFLDVHNLDDAVAIDDVAHAHAADEIYRVQEGA
jgi:hypothetical protein